MSKLSSFFSLVICAVLLAGGFALGQQSQHHPDGLKGVLETLRPENPFKFGFTLLPAGAPQGPDHFAYYAPGDLVGTSGTGPERAGARDWTVYAPQMAFPVKVTNQAFVNSQVWSPGGGRYSGPGPDNQCVRANYTYPWRDNFCERRSGKDRESLNCPSRAIHQGVDIRGGSGGSRHSTCARMAWDQDAPQTLVPVVAAEDGYVEYSRLAGKYVVTLMTHEGRLYRYMHLDRKSLVHSPGAKVMRGETIGFMSDYFGRSQTTHHLHFEILQNMDGKGWSHVPPYMSLVKAYERDHRAKGILVKDER